MTNSSLCGSSITPPCPRDLQVTELSVILDSSFFFDVQGTLAFLLEYAQEDPSRAYSPTCAEVCKFVVHKMRRYWVRLIRLGRTNA